MMRKMTMMINMKYLKKFEGFFGDGITTGAVLPKHPNPHLSKEDLVEESEESGIILDKRIGFRFKKIYIMTIRFKDCIEDVKCNQDFYYNHKIGEEVSIKKSIHKR